MTFDERQLDEIKANEAWLARFESPVPDGRRLSDVKRAVRHAVNERWLTDSAAPVPDEPTLADVKAAIRRALLASGTVPMEPKAPSSPWVGERRLLGALSAAALIAVAIGVIRLAPTNQSEPVQIAATEAPEEAILEVLEPVVDEMTSELLSIEAGLKQIESESWSGVDSYESNLDLELDTLWEEIEQLDLSTRSVFGTS